MLSDFDVHFVDRGYGKNYVQLLHVERKGLRHSIKEVEVDTRLTLSDDKDYLKGDNSSIVATDSQKNTVYVLAKQHGVRCVEEFAQLLAKHFLNKYHHVTKALVRVEEKPWARIKQGGVEHSHCFIQNGDAVRFTEVELRRNEPAVVSSGLKDMKVLKTTKSAFVNFIKDEYRSLPDMEDRIFCTIVYAKWKYGTNQGVNYDQSWTIVKEAFLEVFAGSPSEGVYSPSVQKTLYDAQKLALSKIPQMSEIEIVLPNVHAYQFDFKKLPLLGIDSNNEVFQPTDKPSGNIQATLRRHKAKL